MPAFTDSLLPAGKKTVAPLEVLDQSTSALGGEMAEWSNAHAWRA